MCYWRPLFWHGRQRTWSANFGQFHFEVCVFWQVVAPDPSIEVSEDFFIHRASFSWFVWQFRRNEFVQRSPHAVDALCTCNETSFGSLHIRQLLGNSNLLCFTWKVCTEAVHSVALWTRVTLGLDMCKVCTEAVHSVALWTRVTLQVWTCVHYVPNHWKRRKVHENIRPDINAPPETAIDPSWYTLVN